MRQGFNAYKICEALSDPTRTKILQHLLKKYPEAQTIGDIMKILSNSVSATTVSFHLRKLREAGLITTDGHKRGFRASRKAVTVNFDSDGFHVMEE